MLLWACMKITPSLAGAMSGSMGGITASHNRGGAYFRHRVIPTNPNSGHQQGARGSFGSLVQAWSTALTGDQKAGWTAYANATPRTDTLGQTLVLTGQQAYIGSNTARLLATAIGLTPGTAGLFDRVDDPPLLLNTGPSITAVTTFTISAAGDELVFEATLSAPTDADFVAFLFVGRQVSNGTNFYKAPFTLAATGAGAATNVTVGGTIDPTDPTAWAWPSISDPVAPIGGGRYPVRLTIAYVDGRYSQPFTSIQTLTELPVPP